MNLPKKACKNYSSVNRNKSKVRKQKYTKKNTFHTYFKGFFIYVDKVKDYSNENSLVKELKK